MASIVGQIRCTDSGAAERGPLWVQKLTPKEYSVLPQSADAGGLRVRPTPFE